MAAAALPFVKQGISIGVGLIQNALAQHTARLHDAKDENSALDAVIPAFDQDLTQIAAVFNSGQCTKAEAIAALLSVDTNVYNYLASLVGKAGTAWGAPTTATIGTGLNPTYSAACDKRCTASCCVYLNDLRPAIFGRVVGTSYAPWSDGKIVHGMIEAIQNGQGDVKVITVAPPTRSAYGNYSRAGYVIPIRKPKITISTGALESVDSAVATMTQGQHVPLLPTSGTMPGNVATIPTPDALFSGNGSLSLEGISQATGLSGFMVVAGLFILAVLVTVKIVR